MVSLLILLHHFLFTQDGEEEEFKDLAEEDDDEEERFVDADKQEEGVVAAPEVAKPAASWVHHQNLEGVCFLLSGLQWKINLKTIKQPFP